LINIDYKVHRKSTDHQDMFIARIGAIASFALALYKMAHLFDDETNMISSLTA
jgi:xylose isomerase